MPSDTLGDALERLTRAHPPLRRHLFREDGTLRAYVNVYVNRTEARQLDGPATRLRDGDEVFILPSIAGG